ncbi:MAG: hypothetical protein R3D61_11040 [Defluviimonas denitrificans]
MSSFLVLVGLAGLAVGGVGIASAVVSSGWQDRDHRRAEGAGAEGRTIFATYLIQIAALTALGVGLGLVLGAGLPIPPGLPSRRNCRSRCPSARRAALAEAALYGVLTALVFALWLLASDARFAAALFRDLGPGAAALAGMAAGTDDGGGFGALILSAVALSACARWRLGRWRGFWRRCSS